MTLLDHLTEVYSQSKPQPKKCKVEMELDRTNASDKERQALDGMLAITAYSPVRPGAIFVNTTALAQALRSAGLDVSDKTLERHRKKQCICFKSGAKE